MLEKLFFSRVTVLVVLVIVVGIGSCKSVGDPVNRIRGKIVNGANAPVEGATISLETEKNGEIRKVDLDQKTQNNGNFDFGVPGNMPDNMRIKVVKEGYKTVEKQLNSDEREEITITLSPEIK